MQQAMHATFQFCKFMSRTSEFLEVKPSRQAAVAVWMAIAMIESSVADKLGLVLVKQVCKTPHQPDALSIWSDSVQ